MYPFRAVAFELDSRAWSTGDFHLVLRPGLFAPWAERTRQTYPTLGFWRNGETLICFASEFLDIEPSCPPPVGTARVFRGAMIDVQFAARIWTTVFQIQPHEGFL